MLPNRNSGEGPTVTSISAVHILRADQMLWNLVRTAILSVTITPYRRHYFSVLLRPGCRWRTIDRKAAIGDGDDLVDKGRRCLTAL
jgi:hypothetical protein